MRGISRQLVFLFLDQNTGASQQTLLMSIYNIPFNYEINQNSIEKINIEKNPQSQVS